MSKQMEQIIPDAGSRLYVDAGNSSLKFACQSGVGAEWRAAAIPIEEAFDFIEWVKRYIDKLEEIVIASVVTGTTNILLQNLPAEKCTVVRSADIPQQFLDYKTPDTLGIDRFLACYGAAAASQGGVVVVDAGTACTVDYMSADMVYHGGVIMPGIKALEDAFKSSAPGLPQFKRAIPKQWPGKSTEESLQWGTAGLFRDAILSYLNHYEESAGDYTLWLTGGSAGWLDSVLDAEASVSAMLVLEGLRSFVERE